jgi:hypothetical protein
LKTPKFAIRPFQPGDYEAVATVQWAGDTYGPAFTATVDGQVAGCAGIVLSTYAPVGRAWVCVGALGRRHGVFIARGVRRFLQVLIRDYQLVRVEADSLASDLSAHRWLGRMGFEDEGLMRKKGPKGEDMIRFALIPKEGA